MATTIITGRRKAAPSDVCRMVITIRGESYSVRPLRPECDDVTRAWRLRKSDGTSHVVAETIHGASCDCGDQAWRHEGRDDVGCKHIRSCRALGLIADRPPLAPTPRDYSRFAADEI